MSSVKELAILDEQMMSDDEELQMQQLQPSSIETATAPNLESRSMSFCENISSNQMLRKLREQRAHNRGTDVKLVAGGVTFKAHRSVLSASSAFFESILRSNKSKQELTLSIPNGQCFDVLLEYMYTGELKLDPQNVEPLLKLADHFSILKLRCYCEAYLEKFTSLENCLKVRELIEIYSLTASTLSDSCSNFIHENLTDVLAHESFLHLSFKRMESFMTDPRIGCDNVSLNVLLSALTRWLNQDFSDRTIDYQKLLMIINWLDYEPSQILDYLKEEPLFKENLLALYFLLSILEYNKILREKALFEEYVPKYEELKALYERDEVREEEVGQMPMDDDSVEMGSVQEVIDIQERDVEPEVSKKKVTRSRVTRRTAAAKPKPAVQEVERRPTKRQIKKRYDSQDWVVDDSGRRKKNSTGATGETSSAIVSDESLIVVNAEEISEPTPSTSKVSLRTRSRRGKLQNEKSEVEVSDEADTKEDSDDLDTILDGELSESEMNDDLIGYKTEFTLRGKRHSASIAEWRRGVKCSSCCYVGYSALRLEQHLRKVHQEETTFDCKLCDFSCKWNREFYKHMKGHYTGPPYRCGQCDYTCDRIQFILSHQMRHTDEKPFFCDKCSFRSRTRGNLLVHFRVHTGEKPYKCQFCDKRFAMKNTLDQHLATHREERPYLCDTCGFSTKYQSHLLSHKRIHTGNVFHCDHEGCTYFSPRKSQLSAHMRSHLSIRTHICSTCGRAFIERSHLIRHERIHLEDKPFKCDHCNYASTRRDKLKEHISKHHNQGQPEKAPRPRRRRYENKFVSLSQNIQLPGGGQVNISLPKDVVQLPQNVSIAIGDEVFQSQIVVTAASPGSKNATTASIQTSNGQEIQIANMSEQDLANANFLYETANGELAFANGRILIQNAVEYLEESETVIIEQKDEGEEDRREQTEGTHSTDQLENVDKEEAEEKEVTTETTNPGQHSLDQIIEQET